MANEPVPTPEPYYTPDNLTERGEEHLAYIYNVGDQVNGPKPFQHLVTMDVPGKRVVEGVIANRGLVIKSRFAAEDRLYALNIPGISENDSYKASSKLRFRWKSKKFSFPGRTTLAAAKINRSGCGDLVFRLYEDCREVYACYVCDCRPFRLPPNIYGVDFQIGLEGTATVHDVHVASSIYELIEEG